MIKPNTQRKAPGAKNATGLNTDTNGTDFASQGTSAHDAKAIADQIARLALAGHHVNKGDMGDYTVCKYGMARYCADLAELGAFAQKLGVK